MFTSAVHPDHFSQNAMKRPSAAAQPRERADGPPVDEVGAFERRLRVDATLWSEADVSTSLAQIFRKVADRRTRRTRRSGGRISPAAAVAPPAAIATPTDKTPLSGPAPAPTGQPGTVLSIEDVAADVRIIRVGRPPGLQFVAGQYVKLGVPGKRNASYSLASAPHEAHVEFCVELIPGGRLSPSLFALRAGDAVTLSDAPKGKFLLESAPIHLMVATVTGIAPLRSMLRDALHRGSADEFVVLHGASHQDELPYLDELTALAGSSAHVTYRPTVSRPTAAQNAGWAQDVGRVDDLACRVSATVDSRRTHVYACGHPEMVRRVRGELGSTFPVSSEVFD